jgi:peptide-methionine (S)-S-oxide reductase
MAVWLGMMGGCSRPGGTNEIDNGQPSQPEKTGENTSSTPDDPAASRESEKETRMSANPQQAMFGAGCFWGVQATFDKTPGVLKTTVGYAGGKTKNPTYKDICTDSTGHAEVILIEFDPAKVSYDQLLDVFFTNHNPTTLNRQGPDVGTQYRSAIFFYSPDQEAAAAMAKEKWQMSGKWKKPIVTEIVAAGEFYAAEDYHQKYLAKRGLDTCHAPDLGE